MTKTTPRARYTLEFKQAAVRMVEGGQSLAAAARTLGVVDETLLNWVKGHRTGKVKGCLFLLACKYGGRLAHDSRHPARAINAPFPTLRADSSALESCQN